MKDASKTIRTDFRKNLLVFLLLAVFSFVLLFVCTASSPRYSINPWNDANAFLTVGRSMASGLTIYKDIFEQKGPLLYLFHAVACLISDSSFLGVYIVQSVFFSATMFAAYKIASLYLKPAQSLISVVLFGFLTVNSGCYYYGDSAEEFCLPFLTVSIYYLCRFFVNTEQHEPNKAVFLLVGFFAGCVAMIKFSIIGFWFAWAAYILLFIWLGKKSFKKAFIGALLFLGGMAAAIVPWLVYFAVKGALYDFINTYFVLNITAYPKAESMNFIIRLLMPIHSLGENIMISPVVCVLGFLGIILFSATNIFAEKKFSCRASVPFVCCFGLYVIYFGIRYYNYYLIPLTTFTIFFFISVIKCSENLLRKKAATVSVILCVVIIPLAVIASNYCNLSSRHAPRRGEETVQSEIADYIMSHNPNGKILNYSSLDIGIYLEAKQIPAFKHFEKQNLLYEKYPDNVDEQNRYIVEKLPCYVVISSKSDTDLEKIYIQNSALKNDYSLVMEQNHEIYESPLTNKKTIQRIYLFQLKED